MGWLLLLDTGAAAVFLTAFISSFWHVYRVMRMRADTLNAFMVSDKTDKPNKFLNTGTKRVSQQEYEQGLQTLLKLMPHSDLGALQLAPPISHVIVSESCGHLLGLSAVLMQLAHPYVAYGLKHHSYAHSKADLAKRFLNTLRYAGGVMFGTNVEMEQSSRHVRNLHNHVQGSMQEDAKLLPDMYRGQHEHDHEYQYAANDVVALQWVQATAIESGIFVYEMFVRTLTRDEKEQHYQYVRRILSPIWGIDPREMPATWDAFLEWYTDMTRIGALCVTPPARAMFDLLLPHRWRRLHDTTLLPRSLRQSFLNVNPQNVNPHQAPVRPADEYRFTWSTQTLLSCTLYALARMVYQCIPKRMRQPSAYSQWKRRQQHMATLGWPERLGETVGQWILRRIAKEASSAPR